MSQERLGETQLARLLVERRCPAVDGAAPREVAGLWPIASRHGVDLVLAARILDDERSWTAESRRLARDLLMRAAVVEEVQRRELLRVVRTLGSAGVPALLLKGAAWAYTAYAHPPVRRRLDTDLLVPPARRADAERALVSNGYEPDLEHLVPEASAQSHFRFAAETGVVHALDLHWRVTNRLAFVDALPFATLWRRSVAVERLEGARTTGDVDSLLLACLHRLAHHGASSGLLWLYDVHLLAGRLRAAQWTELAGAAAHDQLQAVCARSLAQAMERFGTGVPASVLAALASAPPRPCETALFGRRVTALDALRSDLRALPGWRARVRIVGHHLFPAPAYMRARFGVRGPVLLPVAYARRAIVGLGRWLSARA